MRADGSTIEELKTVQEKHFQAGRFKESLDAAEHMLRLAKEGHGENSSQYASVLTRKALVLATLGQFRKAEQLLKATIQIYRTLQHESVPLAMINLGRLYLTQGRFGEAETLLREAQSGYPDVIKKSPAYHAALLNNLGEAYRLQRKFEKAARSFHEVLVIEGALYPENHPSIAISRSNLALVYLAQKLYDKAEPLFLQALQIQEKHYQKAHPYVAKALNNIGYLYFEKKEFRKARRYLRRALSIREMIYPSDHPLINELKEVMEAIEREEKE